MDDTRWLDPHERQAWMSFVATKALLDSALDRQLQRDAGLPHAYYQILAMLSELPGRSARMTDLAAITQSSQSRLSHAISRLEQAGWVARLPCPQDRRATLATLTDAGFETLAAAAPGHVAAVRQRLFDRLTPEQVGQLRDICRCVLAGLAGEPGTAAMPPGARPDPPDPVTGSSY